MNIQKAKSEPIWRGIANVRPHPHVDVLDGAPGAHVALFGFAEDGEAFLRFSKKLMHALGFEILELDEVEQMTLGAFRKWASDDVFEVACSLTPEAPVGYGTFYAYPIESS